MTDAFKTVVESPWVKLAMTMFFIGVAWSDLKAGQREDQLRNDAKFAMMASDIHVLKVLACKSNPHDSVCTP